MKRFKLNRKLMGILLCCLMFLVFALSIGYAALSVTLNISGNTQVNATSWDIHFANPVVKTGSVSDMLPSITSSTTVSFSTNLVNPGDFYEFTIDVVNGGGIDALISGVTKSPTLTEAQSKYLNYIIEYSDGSAINTDKVLKSEETDTIKVRLEYRTDLNASDLPSSTETINLSFKLDYVQTDSEENDNTEPPVEEAFACTIDYSGNMGFVENVYNSYGELSLNIKGLPAGVTYTSGLDTTDYYTGGSGVNTVEINQEIYDELTATGWVQTSDGQNITCSKKLLVDTVAPVIRSVAFFHHDNSIDVEAIIDDFNGTDIIGGNVNEMTLGSYDEFTGTTGNVANEPTRCNRSAINIYEVNIMVYDAAGNMSNSMYSQIPAEKDCCTMNPNYQEVIVDMCNASCTGMEPFATGTQYVLWEDRSLVDPQVVCESFEEYRECQIECEMTMNTSVPYSYKEIDYMTKFLGKR